MSTPTVNTAANQGLAKVVTDLEHQALHTPNRVGPPDLREVVELAERMRTFAGTDFDDVIERIWEAREAIDRTLAEIDQPTAPSDLLDLNADQVADRFREAAKTRAATMIDTVGYSSARRTWETFSDTLAASACEALKPAADVVVTNLQPDFERHLKAIKAADKAGITEDTDPAGLLESGTPAQITAFRNLTGAVAGLEQVAGLRLAMTDVLGYGPREPAVLAFVTGLTAHVELQGAWNRYANTTETMQYNQPFVGSTFVDIQMQRLGGRWLALVNNGYELRLNTAVEAQAMYAAVQGT